MRRPVQIGSIGVMSVVALVAIIVVIGGLVAVTSRLDQTSSQREQTVVANGLNGHIKEIAQMVVPQADWDDAVKYLANGFDRAWAQQNIGQFLGGTDGFEGAIVLGVDDKPLYGWVDGAEPVNPMAYNAFVLAAATSVEKVRAEERVRPSLIGRKPVDGLLNPAIQAGDIRNINGQLYVLTATLVQPDFGRSMPPPRSAVVITAQAIDAGFLKDFGNRYMLANLHLTPANAPSSRGLAGVPLLGSDGRPVAVMQWTPQAPGAQLRNHVAPAIFVLAACMFGVVIVLNRKARKAAHGLVASEARAKHMAVHDALTGLPNRTLFNDRLGLALDASRRTGSQVAVLIVDLDRFKEVNDTFGHHCGDELIREAAKRLAGTVRSNETLARLGGDEFAIVQPDATAATAAALAERIRLVVAGPVDISAGRVHLACTSGVAVMHGRNVEPGEVLRQADLALYRAKERRRGGYCFFEPEMDAALRTRKALEADLREAIETEQLQMVYQPQVNGRGKVVGVEALVRWTHPIRGQVSPAYFVPIAEECGLIEQLGFYTLKKAFADSKRWPKLKVAVNMSASQLRIPDFLARLEALVTEMAVDPIDFELEITEGVLLGDDQGTHQTLSQLREMGFGLALDDFGTGYSSLSYLRRYPVSKIKIDRSFITNLGVDKESGDMVSAIVRLAKALGLAVIAEGVETDEQRKHLVAAGCPDIQGYLFGKPSSPDVIDSMIGLAPANRNNKAA